MRLDKFLKKNSLLSIKNTRQLILKGKAEVSGVTVRNIQYPINAFSHVRFNGVVIQEKIAQYIMLNKPPGVVSATWHETYKTVLDCLKVPYKNELHLAGRLDFNTTGLIVLTNNGSWSQKLTQPVEKIPKTYLVKTEDPITKSYEELFSRGMYFQYENITLMPASLHILDDFQARITIYEGRYHQIKRMFGHFNNKVIALHRESMGDIVLDDYLLPGEYRDLSQQEIDSLC